MANIKTIIISIVSIVWALCLALIMGIITWCKVARGTATRYTNARHMNGRKWTLKEFFWQFGQYQLPCTLYTDQGVIAAIHGLPGGYWIGGKAFGEEILSQVFPQKKLILVSCCNGTHRDFTSQGRTFTRDINTLSEHSSILLLTPWGDFLTWGGKGVDIYQWLLQGEFRLALAVARS